MPKMHYQHFKLLILDPAQNAIVIDSIAPELAELPLEALAELPGIVGTRHAGIEEREDPP